MLFSLFTPLIPIFIVLNAHFLNDKSKQKQKSTTKTATNYKRKKGKGLRFKKSVFAINNSCTHGLKLLLSGFSPMAELISEMLKLK